MAVFEDTKFEETRKYQIIGAWSRYSTWTARVTVLMDYYSLKYEARYFNFSPESKAELQKLSPSALVPVLIDNNESTTLTINDSLAILLHLAEAHPSLPLFPADRQLRAIARSATAEMHSGFSAIRDEFTGNFIGKYVGNIPISDRALKDLQRIFQIWTGARKATVQRAQEGAVKDEGWLCGEFGIVDAFFWPVLWRIRSYNLPLTAASPEVLGWLSKMWNDPKIKEVIKGYYRQADNPETTIPHYDDVFRGNPSITYGKFDEDWKFQL